MKCGLCYAADNKWAGRQAAQVAVQMSSVHVHVLLDVWFALSWT